MDNEEQEQLDDIHNEVKGSHAQLGAINERTRNIESSVDDISSEVDKNRQDINDLEDKVTRNTTIVGGVSGGIGMIALWLADKVSRLV
jgi:predicted  nucleic acid-binding Zn-ribbon protein